MRAKLGIILTLLPAVFALDWATKRWALETLPITGGELFDGLIPLTLAFNKGAAFGISIGEDSRLFFIPLTFAALGMLALLLKQARKNDYLRIVSVTLVMAGALGNLYDRMRWDRGVVDFIGSIDLIYWDFPIFNVADIAISCGAVLLTISFWLEDRGRAARKAAEADAAASAAAAAVTEG